MFIDEWESYVKKVVILGYPARMEDMAGEWDVLLRRLSTVADSLRDGVKDLERGFQGAAGDAYRQRLASIITQIEQLDTEHRPVADLLRASAQDLTTAKAAMPIPVSALADVHQLQAAVLATNPVNGYVVAAGLSTFSLQSQVLDAAIDVFTDDTGEARNVVQHLNQTQQTALDRTTDPTGADGRRTSDKTGFDTSSPGAGGRPVSGVSGVAGGAALHSSAMHSPASRASFGPLHSSDAPVSGYPADGAGDATGLLPGEDDSQAWNETGLAGAGGGGFQGASGLGSAHGMGSLGAGTVGSFGAGGGVGGGSSLAAPLMDGTGPAAGMGRGIAGGPMMAGGGGGARTRGGGDEERSTWLEEDEDVWGLNEENVPPNLGRAR